ncbi:MAG: Hpt domain-containing protein [Bacillota bacterium]|nr:Hpt domain-containing protein [Bacillota bacterium]
MITIDKLKELGADVDSGLARCINNEEFYLKMVTMALQGTGFEALQKAVEDGNLDEAFERAHSLKGVLGNVSLTSLYEPVAEMTEELRSRNDIDYAPYLETVSAELNKYRSLL